MANILTGIRILCGLLLLLFPAFSKWYYVFYLLGGFTDTVDGAVARKRGEATDFGAKFDTAADFVFALAVIGKIAGSVHLPVWLLLWIGLIVLIKTASIAVGAIKYRRFVTVHSVLNKVCGAVVFVLPLLLGGTFAWQVKVAAIISACTLATVAAIREDCLIRSGNVA